MIDTHCHLTHRRFDGDRAEVVERARDAGLEACVSIGTGVADAQAVRALTQEHPDFIHGTAGLDPFTSHAAGEGFDDEFQKLAELIEGGSFCAVGEIGLDFHYDLDPAALQIERFELQLELAGRLELPVVIHVREAHEEMIRVLAGHPGNHGVIHSFTAGPAEAEAYLDLGWYLAFNGVLTFRNAEGVREAARMIPADRLLVETDSPYLAPIPHRGKRCEPAYVARTLDRLAEVRDQPVEAVRSVTRNNARTLFRLGEDP